MSVVRRLAGGLGHFLLVFHQVEPGVNQRNVRKPLREIADEPFRIGVVLFGEQPKIRAQVEQSLE